MICCASVELAPKLNVTFVPGWAASNAFPRSVNAPVSDAAAKTVIDPERAGAVDDAVVVGMFTAFLDDPQAVRATLNEAASTAGRMKRRNRCDMTLLAHGG